MMSAATAALLAVAQSPMQELAVLLGPQAAFDAFTPDERLVAKYCWPLWARKLARAADPTPPKKAPGFGMWRGQLPPPGAWSTWLYMAGRGSGKTRAGAEQIRVWKDRVPGCRIALVGATAGDVWGTMVEGDSGVVACCPPWDQPEIHTIKRRLRWRNGSSAYLYSAEKPRRLRGPQHHFAWADELGAWRYMDAYDQLMLGLRLGTTPQALITTTPIPISILRDLLGDAATAVTIGSSRDNAANIALQQILRKYEGTTLARQELEGELLDQSPGALWKRSWFQYVPEPPQLDQIAVGLDPAETSKSTSDDAGIVTAGRGADGFAYVLRDSTQHATPDAWAKVAVGAYWKYGAGQMVVDAGRNGEMVKSLIRMVDSRVRVVIKGGNKGKRAWAETVSALYEQGRVRHLDTKNSETGRLQLAEMEDQMCTWTDDAKWSPDRMDAAVYAISAVMFSETPKQGDLNRSAAGEHRRRI